jgi:4-oxalocrotonate tautomerase
MPFVNVKITSAITTEQSRQVIQEITDSLVRILDKKPEQTHIVIEEIEHERWGFGGMLTSDIRDKG